MKDILPAIATIVAALLSAAAAIIVSSISSKRQHDRYLTELDKQFSLVTYRMEQLENKVNAHNTFDHRIVSLEEQAKNLKDILNRVMSQIGVGIR